MILFSDHVDSHSPLPRHIHITPDCVPSPGSIPHLRPFISQHFPLAADISDILGTLEIYPGEILVLKKC